jgi:ankyrin repeat protein
VSGLRPYYTALHCAAEDTVEPKMVQLLLEKGADIVAKNIANCTALHLAVQWGLETTHVLLGNGIHVTARNDEGKTALHEAILGGNTEIVELLLEKGADITARDNQNRTALHAAVDRWGYDKDRVQLLLDSLLEERRLAFLSRPRN